MQKLFQHCAGTRRNSQELAGTFLLVIFILLIPMFSKAQLVGNCGTLQKIVDSTLFKQQTPFKIFDRFGNAYLPQELVISNTTQSLTPNNLSCQSGYFTLDFEDAGTGQGFDDPILGPDRIDVVCKVFTDLSKLLLHGSKNGRVKILIAKSDFELVINNTNSDYLAAASAMTVIPVGMNSYGHSILDNEVWRTITSETNSYTNIPGNTNLYHGILRVNFGDISQNVTLYNLDPFLNPALMPINQFDFYSVILHQSLHLIGLASGFQTPTSGINNSSLFYRYDTQIGGWSPTSSSWHSYFPVPFNFLNTSANSLNITNYNPQMGCNGINSNKVIFSLSPSTYTSLSVFTPNIWQNNTSLSHFNCDNTCASTNYVMQSCTQSGPSGVLRYLTGEEREALCRLNYFIGNEFGYISSFPQPYHPYHSYGNMACTSHGCLPYGVNDIFNYQANTTVFSQSLGGYTQNAFNIPIASILSNDKNINVICSGCNLNTPINFDIIQGSGQVSTNITPGYLTFIPNSNTFGWVIIAYQPNCSNGDEFGNITYIWIQVNDNTLACPSSGICPNQIICHGDFEDITDISMYSNFIMANVYPYSPSLGNTPDLYKSQLAPTPPDICEVNNPIPLNSPAVSSSTPGTNYVGLMAYIDANGFEYKEGIVLPLNTLVMPGQTFSLNLDVFAPDCAADLVIALLSDYPCDPSVPNSSLTSYWTYCGISHAIPTVGIIPTILNDWETHTVDITVPSTFSPTGAKYLLVGTAANNITGINQPFVNYIFVDNIFGNISYPISSEITITSVPPNCSIFTNANSTVDMTYEICAISNVTNMSLTTNMALSNTAGTISGLNLIAGQCTTVHIPINIGSIQGNLPSSGFYVSPIVGNACIIGNVPNDFIVPQYGDLKVEKEIINASPTGFSSGSTVSFIVKVTNNTNLPMPLPNSNTEITVIDDITTLGGGNITGFDVGSVISSDFSLSGNTLSAHINNSIPPNGGFIYLSYQINIDNNSTCGTLTNCVTAISPNQCFTANDCKDIQITNTGYAQLPAGFYNINSNINFSNVNWEVNGVITINSGTVTLNNAHFSMTEGSSIVVKPGAKLLINNNSILFGCASQWKGIILETGLPNSGDIAVNNSTIKDAQYGIHVQNPIIGNNSVITLANAHFLQNFVGIKVDKPSVIGLYNTTNIDFKASVTFDGANNLLADYTQPSIQAPATSNHKALAGMWLEDMGNSIGIPSLNPPIHFQNMSNGILAHNTNMTVNRCMFEHIQPEVAYNTNSLYGTNNLVGIGNGSAIMSEGQGGSLTVQGFATQTVNFQDCYNGIVTERLKSIDISRNRMENIQYYGISNALANGGIINIASNYVKSNICGILLLQNINMQLVELNNNEISVSKVGNPTGISLWSNIIVVGNATNHKIIDNYLNVGSSTVGIYAQNADRIAMVGNNITQDVASIQGIYLGAANGSRLNCNRVGGDNNYNIDPNISGASLSPVGISVWSSPDVEISCNQVSRLGIGIDFHGACNNMDLHANGIGDAQVGMLLESSAVIGNQYYKGNRFTGTNFFGAWAVGSFNGSEFYLWPGSPSYMIPINANLGWFTQLAGQGGDPSSWACGNYCYLNEAERLRDTTLSSLDYTTAKDSIQDVYYAKEIQWHSDKYLYDKLRKNTELIPTSGVIHDFYTETSTQSAGKFSRLAEKQDSIHASTQDSLLNLYFAQAENTEQQLWVNDSLFEVSQDSIYFHQNQTFMQNLLSLKTQIRYVYAAIQTEKQNKATLLEVENNNITTNELFEENEQAVNEIYLATLARENYQFTETQINTLATISAMCPAVAGNAVFRARSMYFLFHPMMRYDDPDICGQVGVSYRTLPSKTEETKMPLEKINISFYPNPANDMLNISLSDVLSTDLELVIYNTLGMEVSRIIIPNNTTTYNLSTASLASGMYFIQTNHKMLVKLSSKLIIQH